MAPQSLRYQTPPVAVCPTTLKSTRRDIPCRIAYYLPIAQRNDTVNFSGAGGGSCHYQTHIQVKNTAYGTDLLDPIRSPAPSSHWGCHRLLPIYHQLSLRRCLRELHTCENHAPRRLNQLPSDGDPVKRECSVFHCHLFCT